MILALSVFIIYDGVQSYGFVVRYDDVATITWRTTRQESGKGQYWYVFYVLQYSSDGLKTHYRGSWPPRFNVSERVQWVKKIDPISNKEYTVLQKIE